MRVFVGGHGGHRVFDEDLIVAEFVGEARGAFDADICGDAAEDDRGDAATTELEIELCAGECAPLSFYDDEVARLRSHLRNDVGPAWRGIRRGECDVRKGVKRVFPIWRRRHVDKEDGHVAVAKRFCEFGGVFDDRFRRMWRERTRDDAFLEVNDNKSHF